MQPDVVPARISRSLRLCLTLALVVACSPTSGGGSGEPSGTGGAGGGPSGTGGRNAQADAAAPPATGTGGTSTGGGAGGGGGSGTGTGGSAGEPAASGGSGGGRGGDDAGSGSSPDVATPTDGTTPNETPSKSPGCASGEGLPEGDGTIMVGGLNRQYRVRLPKNYSKDRAWPLVLALHPNGGAGVGFYDGDARPVRKLLEEKAVLIVPLARPKGSGWDWRGNGGTPKYDILPDLAYFDALITRVKTQLCIDETRIFSMGFSGGASFSGVLACMRKDIRAIAVAGSVIYFDDSKCVNTPAVWVAIGKGELTADRTEFKDFWSKRAGCQMTAKPVEPSPCVAYACPTGTPVHYCEHPAGHTWPGFATAAAVDFFSKF